MIGYTIIMDYQWITNAPMEIDVIFRLQLADSTLFVPQHLPDSNPALIA